jgi:hypothetical protein
MHDLFLVGRKCSARRSEGELLNLKRGENGRGTRLTHIFRVSHLLNVRYLAILLIYTNHCPLVSGAVYLEEWSAPDAVLRSIPKGSSFGELIVLSFDPVRMSVSSYPPIRTIEIR